MKRDERWDRPTDRSRRPIEEAMAEVARILRLPPEQRPPIEVPLLLGRPAPIEDDLPF